MHTTASLSEWLSAALSISFEPELVGEREEEKTPRW